MAFIRLSPRMRSAGPAPPVSKGRVIRGPSRSHGLLQGGQGARISRTKERLVRELTQPPMNQMNELQKPGERISLRVSETVFVTAGGCFRNLQMLPSEPIIDTDASSHVPDHPSHLDQTEPLPDSVETTSEDPPEVHGMSEDRPRNRTRPGPSSWERKKLSCSEGFCILRAGRSAFGVDPWTDLGVAADSDRTTGCVGLESDRREPTGTRSM